MESIFLYFTFCTSNSNSITKANQNTLSENARRASGVAKTGALERREPSRVGGDIRPQRLYISTHPAGDLK